MVKKIIAFIILYSAFSAPLFADVYMKNRGINGMAEMETWTSGKKQRMSVDMPMVGEIITITRADKGVQWEINSKLRIYQEKPLAIPYTDDESGNDEAAAFDGMEKMEAGSEGGESECVTTKSGERVFAGYKAQGFSTSCGEGPSTTLWMAETNQGGLKDIKKEMDAFSAAQVEATYANYPEKEREKILETMRLLGTAMAQGLMGMPDPKNLPDGFPVGMEGGGEDADGQARSMMMMEVTALEQVPHDASRYELPAGFTLTENIHDAMAQQMIGQMASGETNLADMMKGFGDMAERMGIPPEEMEGEELSYEETQMMNEMGQGTAQFVQAQMQAQSVLPAERQQRPDAPLPTDAPVEAWQQNLYSQAPGAQAYPQQGVSPAYGNAPRQQNGNPYVQGRRAPQTQTQPLVDPQAMQQIMGTVQGLASQLGGGGGYGGMEQLLQGYEQDDGYSEDYAENYPQEYEGGDGNYYAE